MMFASVALLILGLTLGAAYGFKTAKFLVPFLLVWPLIVLFFFWESKLPEGYALIPPSTWKVPNMTLMMVYALGLYGWFACNQLVMVQRFHVVFGEKPIIVAVRLLAQGIPALCTGPIVS
jgi:hypothetical protein